MPDSAESYLIKEMALHGYLESFVRAKSEVEFVNQYQLEEKDDQINDNSVLNSLVKDLKIPDEESLNRWRMSRGLQDYNDFVSYAHYLYKKKHVIDSLLKGVGESLFLRYKDRLDRVLYSLIRVESLDLAYEIYYSIDSSELEFGTAAETHSCGPESKTQGIIGPVDLTTPHPEIAARLRTANPRQLFEPFKADEWQTIIRLEYRFDSEYNQKTIAFLGDLLIGSKSREIAQAKLSQYLAGE